MSKRPPVSVPRGKTTKPSSLNPRHQRFVSEFLINPIAGQAYVKAGYSPIGADQGAARLLRNVHISAAIAEGQAKQIAGVDVTRERIVKELAAIGFVDGRSFYKADGTLKAIAEMSPEQGACLASFEVIKKNAAAGDGVTDTVHKFRVWDKGKALDSLAKLLGYLDNVVQHKGEIKIIHELPS